MTLWTRVLGRLESHVDRHAFATWFRPTTEVEEGQSALTVRVPNPLFVTWIHENYGKVIREALAAEGAPGKELRLVPKSSGSKTAPATSPAEKPGTSLPGAPLEPRYTFDTFVVGSSNQFAHAAALRVAESPARSYNPLFLYGGTGLGKSHLLHAIGHAVLAAKPELRVAYLSAEKFMNETINAIRFERVVEFRERYRAVDILLVDDIQEIAGKERTQVEFFHTFNALHEAQKQVVLSSDVQPRELSTIEERLRSRFEWGLIADIHPPDLETKVAILQKKAALEGADLPSDVALFISTRAKSNVRELEGLLNRVIAYASLTGHAISIDLARATLQDILREENRVVAPAEIIRAVASHYGLRITEIKKKSNTKTIAFPRQVAMYLLRQLTGLSLPEIGKLFGDKHHSTVMHSIERIEKLRAEDAPLDRVLNNLSAPFK